MSYKPLVLLLVVRPGCSEGHASLLQAWLPWTHIAELEFEFVPLQLVLLPLPWYTVWQLEILETTAGGDGVGFLKQQNITVLPELNPDFISEYIHMKALKYKQFINFNANLTNPSKFTHVYP